MNTHHRRRHRRNPGFGGTTRGIGGMLVQGLKDGFTVRIGGGLTQYVSNMVPIGTPGSITQSAVQLGVGTALSLGVKKFMGPRAASFFLAGAAANVIGEVLGGVIPATTPLIGPILGAGALKAWPQPARLSSWVPPRVAAPAMGDYGDGDNPDGIFS